MSCFVSFYNNITEKKKRMPAFLLHKWINSKETHFLSVLALDIAQKKNHQILMHVLETGEL